ncbi:hypothetical protein DFQ26_003405 [Actinomortierella ambigua]|nr:hypothetical protein DFQ26_003405 [Actinomortierella ambigua]
MSGIAAYLQTELVSLSNEARRKNPEIKEAAERVIALLRHPGQGGATNLAAVLSQNQDVLKPFLLACETKNVKLVTISIGCLRELISHRAMPEAAIPIVLKTLSDIMAHGVEIQLKILQTILPLLTNYRVHGEYLADDSRVVFVNNTAAATLRQLVIYIFDKVGEEDRELAQKGEPKALELGEDFSPEDQLEPCAKDAYLLFQDLCLLTNSEQARFLKLASLSKTFGLELIESVLTNHFHLFKQHTEFASLLRERVCPLIIKNFSDKQDFPQTMRLMRVVYILTKQFHEILAIECEIFLSMLIKLLEPEGSVLWQRILAMEIFRGICGDSALLRRIYKTYDQQGTSTDVFSDMIIAIGRLSTEKPQLIGAGMAHEGHDGPRQSHGGDKDGPEGGVGGLSVVTSTMRIQCVDQLDKADPPQIPDTYLYYLSLVCINSIADGLASFVFPVVAQEILNKQQQETKDDPKDPDGASKRVSPPIFPNTNALDLSQHPEAEEIALVTAMTESAWPGLLAAFSYYLGSNLDDELFQNVMRAYQNLTSVCGVLKLTIPRDAFLTSLCKNCLPVPPALEHRSAASGGAGGNAGGGTSGGGGGGVGTGLDPTLPNLSEKNLYCLRVLLNVAQYLGGTLLHSWYLVLETMQQADHLLVARIHRAQQAGRKPASGGIGSNTMGPGGANKSASPGQPSMHRSPSSLTDVVMHQEADMRAILLSFQQLFEMTTYLDLVSFKCFVESLCKLGATHSGLPISDGKGGVSAPFLKGLRHVNKSDNKSFAIEKLRLVCLLNIHRLYEADGNITNWDIAIGYLIETANHPIPSTPIRVQSCDAVSDIVLAAMAYAEQNASTVNLERIQTQVMRNLHEIVRGHTHALVDIQRMGLETLNKLLQTSGQSLAFGWVIVFEMIQSSIHHHPSSRPSTAVNAATAAAVASTPPLAGKDGGELVIGDAPTAVQESHSDDRPSLTRSPSTGATKSSGLVRVAFPCLQLICTDFLSLLNPHNLQLCIDTLAAFGQQREDLNISLTSIGLLWNVSDFIQPRLRDAEKEQIQNEQQQQQQEQQQQEEEESPLSDDIVQTFTEPSLTNESLGGLWMLLLYKMSRLCSDTRPEVRNGAIQTLLRTIQMNAATLRERPWRQCIWKILLPLLDDVDEASCRPVEEALEAPAPPTNVGSFVMRNDSPSKQWDESRVLLFSGMADIFQHFLYKLISLSDYLRAWVFFIEHLEAAVMLSSPDVAIAALKAYQTVVKAPAADSHANKPTMAVVDEEERLASLWETAWKVWERLGCLMVGGHLEPMLGNKREHFETRGRSMMTRFTQETLTEYVTILHHLYPLLTSKFTLKDVKAMLQVIHPVLTYEASPIYRPDIDYLSPLQSAIYDAMCMLQLPMEGGPSLVLSELCRQYLLAFDGSYQAALAAAATTSPSSAVGGSMVVRPSYIALSKVIVTRIVFLLDKFQKDRDIFSSGVYATILRSLGVAMRLRYKCPPSFKHVEDTPLWKSATSAYLEVIKNGIATLESFEKDISDERFIEVWSELVRVCQSTVIPSLPLPVTEMSLKSQSLDESFDLAYLHGLKTKVFSRMGHPRVSSEILQELVYIIDRGANLYVMTGGPNSTASSSAAAAYQPGHPPHLSNAPARGSGGGGSGGQVPPSTPTSATFGGGTSSNTASHAHMSGGMMATSSMSSLSSSSSLSSVDNPSGLGITLHATTGTMVPVRRERFAFACLEILFDLCEDQSSTSITSSALLTTPGAGQETGSNGTATHSNHHHHLHHHHGYGHGHLTFEQQIRTRTGFAATPVLMARCQTLLEAYSADQALLGKCPFPRLRHQEMLLVLKRLEQLRLFPNVSTTFVNSRRSGTASASTGHEQQTSPSSSVAAASSSAGESEKGDEEAIRKVVLAGRTAHLFYLYEQLTDAMFCHDLEVLQLVKRCMKVAGRSIGVSK